MCDQFILHLISSRHFQENKRLGLRVRGRVTQQATLIGRITVLARRSLIEDVQRRCPLVHFFVRVLS